MIRGVHAMFYSPKAEELRAFFRDTLQLKSSDVGDGWLIFDPPEAEVGCHPADGSHHEISFYCDDIRSTVQQLTARGVRFTSEIADQGFGLVTSFQLPDGTDAQLYQPSYKKS